MAFLNFIASTKTIAKNFSIKLACKSKIGRSIFDGVQNGKNALILKFKGLPVDNFATVKSYGKSVTEKFPKAVQDSINDNDLVNVVKRYAQKNNIKDINWSNLSEEEIMQIVLTKCGVGPCKFAQIISSDESIMSKLSPKLQDLIKKTQSENPFSRSLEEAQEIVNRAFLSKKTSTALSLTEVDSNAMTTVSKELTKMTSVPKGIQLIKPLSAGTVGESYLALDTTTGKEVVIKMIKKNVDEEQLELEKFLFKRFIATFAPDGASSIKHKNLIENLYKDWAKELDFGCEYTYNKLLQSGAKRYKVADIVAMSRDKSCIVMQKAEGIQMNNLMKILKDYKSNPLGFSEKYKDLIEENPWLADPESVMQELPDSITKAFDEMFLFMKRDGKSIMHGDPHMGNYFITTNEKGNLIPMYIDTGNCIERNAKQIQEDLKFLTDYFVGNSKGIAKYFIEQCDIDYTRLKQNLSCKNLLPTTKKGKEEFIELISQDIHSHIFGKRQNITNVEEVQKTIQVILEKYGLTMKPEAATAFKAQMQFFTGITETASLQDKVINVGTIVRDIPKALICMLKNKINPLNSVKDAISHTSDNLSLSTSCIYQFMAKPVTPLEIIQTFRPYRTENLRLKSQPNYISIFQ